MGASRIEQPKETPLSSVIFTQQERPVSHRVETCDEKWVLYDNRRKEMISKHIL